MAGYGLIEQMTCVITLLRDYPQGLSILLGAVPPPSDGDICDLLETVRLPSGPILSPRGFPLRPGGGMNFIPEADRLIDSAEKFSRIVGRAGGWKHINAVTRGWRERYPGRWAMLVEHIVWVRPGRFRIDGSMLHRAAAKLVCGKNAVTRNTQLFPQELAVAILNTPYDGQLELETPLAMKAV